MAKPALAIPGLAGVLTGVGLYVQSDSNFQLFQNESDEQKKRALRDKGNGSFDRIDGCLRRRWRAACGCRCVCDCCTEKGIRQSSEDKGTEKKKRRSAAP